MDVKEIYETPFPYMLKEEEIVEEIVGFAKTYEKWPITNIGYVSRFHISHNSNPHLTMSTESHLQGVLRDRKNSLEQVLEELKKISVGEMEVNTRKMETVKMAPSMSATELEKYEKAWLDKDGAGEPNYHFASRLRRYTPLDLVELKEYLQDEITNLNSKVIVSDEQLKQYISIYARTRIKAEKKINSLLGEIIELQKKEIIHHSRVLANASCSIGKKTVTKTQVRDYVNKLKIRLIVPDSKNILYARSNFVMMNLRE
jgi:hypothetical protein